MASRFIGGLLSLSIFGASYGAAEVATGWIAVYKLGWWDRAFGVPGSFQVGLMSVPMLVSISVTMHGVGLLARWSRVRVTPLPRIAALAFTTALLSQLSTFGYAWATSRGASSPTPSVLGNAWRLMGPAVLTYVLVPLIARSNSRSTSSSPGAY